VTVAEYRACVRAGACMPPRSRHVDHIWGPAGRPDVPIAGVTWKQAVDYCAWAGKELPTEEQWEYACRGSAGRDFPWGWKVPGKAYGLPDDIDERIHFLCETCPVGAQPKGATPEGIQDMQSLVGEWTGTIYCPDPVPPGPFDAHRDLKKCTQVGRAVRGGDTGGEGPNTPCYIRSGRLPDDMGSDVGFRCAQRVEEAKP
jgi:formylglycine-generating enzyme required for sulfatase activity